jgi:hypothetical protein
MNTIISIILWGLFILSLVLSVTEIPSFLDRRKKKKISNKIELYTQITTHSHLHNLSPDSISDIISLAEKWRKTKLRHSDRLLLVSAGIPVSHELTLARRLDDKTKSDIQVMATLLKYT